MGSGYSIQIQLHKERGELESTPVVAGSVLQGRVIVELTSPLFLEPKKPTTTTTATSSSSSAPVAASEIVPDLGLLTLKIYGKEKVRMKLSAARKRAHNTNHHHGTPKTGVNDPEYPYPRTAERQFFTVTLPLREFPSASYDTTKHCIIAGTYKFPFQVQLPAVLPASSSYNPYTRMPHPPSGSNSVWTALNGGKKPGFRIQYKMFVELHSVTKKASNGECLRTPSQLLWVVSAPKTSVHSDPVPAMALPLPHEVNTTHGLWTQGTVLTAACLEDAIVSRSDDHMNLHIACRNNSRTDIQRVQLHLVETLRWGTVATSGDANDYVLQEQHNVILFSLNDVQLPTLSKDRVTLVQSFAQSIFGTKNKDERELLKSIHEDLKSDDSKISITLPLQALARDSYSGQLAQVSHHIEIHFLTATAKTSTKKNTNPSIIIPIRMVNGDRHTIECTGSFCNSVTESDTPAHVAATGCASNDYSDIHDEVPFETEIDIEVPLPSQQQQQQQLQQPPLTSNNLTNPYASLIPMAVATIDNNGILLGGDTSITPLSALVPLAAPSTSATATATATTMPEESPIKNDNINNNSHAQQTNQQTPSLARLLLDMRSSVDAYSILAKKCESSQWIHFFRTSVSPYEYGKIIAHVPDPFDQPRVAILLGQHVNHKSSSNHPNKTSKINSGTTVSGLTCEYIAFGIRNTSSQHRATTAKGLLPLCVDAASNYNLIISELSEWDQTVVLQELEQAILQTMPETPNKKIGQAHATTTTTSMDPKKTQFQMAVTC